MRAVRRFHTGITDKTAGNLNIVADIADVTQAADEMTNASTQVNASAIELSELAEKLNTMVKQFRV